MDQIIAVRNAAELALRNYINAQFRTGNPKARLALGFLAASERGE